VKGIGPITKRKLIVAYHVGGSVSPKHFGHGEKGGRNRLPTLLLLGLVAWEPTSKFTIINLTHKGRQFVSENLPTTFPKS